MSLNFIIPPMKAFPAVFLSYKNYIRHLKALLDLSEPCPHLPKPRKNHEEIELAGKQAGVFLRQMDKMKGDPELLPLFTVGAYYAVYFSACGFLLGTNAEVKPSHTGVMKCLANTIMQRPQFLPEPLNVLWHSKEREFLNIPLRCQGMAFVKYSPFSREESEGASWASYQTLLRTTSEKSKKPIVSFMDFFYRLRQRANYKDLDPFVEASQEDPRGSIEFMNDLSAVTWKISNALLRKI
jgi:hypothetical protein